jgi:hypothetical protein
MVRSGVVLSFILHIFESWLVHVKWQFGCGLRGSLGGPFGVLSLGYLSFGVGFLECVA